MQWLPNTAVLSNLHQVNDINWKAIMWKNSKHTGKQEAENNTEKQYPLTQTPKCNTAASTDDYHTDKNLASFGNPNPLDLNALRD